MASEGRASGGADAPLSVSDAVALARGAVKAWPTLSVVGEVTGFRGPNVRSGHCYFQVKDSSSFMDVIVWKGTAAKMPFELRDGLKVRLTGGFDVYQASGKLSFVARRVEAEGEGVLRQQVAALARALEREGLMDAARKRPVPAFCSRVCVVTSLSGDVLDDVKRTLARRNPLVAVDLVDTGIQGKEAPASVVRALGIAASSRPDAILLVRGGGTFEELMCFNDERLARAIAACPVPVVTGIGHEPDVTIADMVADRRCSTPTGAAESVAPAIDEVERQMRQRQARLAHAMQALLASCSQHADMLGRLAGRAADAELARRRVALEALGQRRCLTDPYAPIRDREEGLLLTEQRLHDALPRATSRKVAALSQVASRLDAVGGRLLRPAEAELARLAGALDALSPLAVLARGYAIARDARGNVVRDARALAVGDEVRVRLAQGSIDARVSATREA